MSNQIPDQNGNPVDPNQVPPVAPQGSAPQAGEQYNAPQQPYVAPQQPYEQQHQAPQQPQQPQQHYQAPQQPYEQQQYQAQNAAPAGGGSDLSGTVVLNYWLSVFFTWLPALIFYFTEKGKSELSDQYHRENLNFSLVRTGAIVASLLLIWIPVLGQLLYLAAWLGGLILHIMVAAKAKERFANGEAPGFLFNLKLIK